jgi:hypothetical protein
MYKVVIFSSLVGLNSSSMQDQARDFKTSFDCGIDGSNSRSFLLLSQQNPCFPQHQYCRHRSVQWGNYFHSRIHNHRVVWDKKFLHKSQCGGCKYPNRILCFWLLGSSSLSQGRKWRWQVHGDGMLQEDLHHLGFILFSWDSYSSSSLC